MSDEFQIAKDFLLKNNVKIEIVAVNKNHKPNKEGVFLNIYTIKISRGKKYFFIKGAPGDFQMMSYDIESYDWLIYGVLVALPRFRFKNFKEYCDTFGVIDDNDIQETKYWYKDYQKKYKSTRRLFSDVMDELEEIV
jgi:hypothetical protein